MRKIQLAVFSILIIASLASCSNKPNDKVYGTTSEAGVEFVQIKPTWGQAAHFARERGDHGLWVMIGTVLAIAAFVFYVGRQADARWFPKSISDFAFPIILFVLLIGSAVSFTWQAESIKWNNDVTVPKTQYDAAIKSAGSTQPIWDSLETGCHIVGGPYKCFEK